MGECSISASRMVPTVSFQYCGSHHTVCAAVFVVRQGDMLIDILYPNSIAHCMCAHKKISTCYRSLTDCNQYIREEFTDPAHCILVSIHPSHNTRVDDKSLAAALLATTDDDIEERCKQLCPLLPCLLGDRLCCHGWRHLSRRLSQQWRPQLPPHNHRANSTSRTAI